METETQKSAPNSNESKDTKEMEPRPTLHFIVRSKKGIHKYLGPTEIKELDVLTESATTLAQYSRDGSLLCIVDGNSVSIHDGNTNAIISKIDTPSAQMVIFSSTNKFLVTYTRLTQQITENNLIIWETASGKQVYQMTQKNFLSEHWPVLKWSEDDLVCARGVTNEVLLFNTAKDFAIETRLAVPNITQFALSPNGRDALKVATFVPEKKGLPGCCRIFKYPSTDPVCMKSFFKAQEADLMWNSLGTALLIRSHTDMDKTGKSYYGETGLYFLQADGKFESNIILKKEGPIYDCVWAPNGKEFVVIYGFSPARTTLFGLQCDPIIDFGEAARNTAKWSPNGRVLCVAGFGNMSGQMDFWDRKKVKKLGSAQAHTTSHYEWSSDGQYLLTGVLFPRMRIDNEFRVWNYDGTLIYRQQYAGTELYQVNWKPIPMAQLPEFLRNPNKLPKPIAKPLEVAVQAPKPAKYVHPNFSGRSGSAPVQRDETPVKYKREQQQQHPKPRQETPPGYDFADEDAKKKKKKPAPGQKAQPPQTAQQPAFIVIEEPDFGEQEETLEKSSPSKPLSGVEAQKRAKMIHKKLRQIDELKQQQKTGKELSKDQQGKITSEASLRKELSELTL